MNYLWEVTVAKNSDKKAQREKVRAEAERKRTRSARQDAVERSDSIIHTIFRADEEPITTIFRPQRA